MSTSNQSRKSFSCFHCGTVDAIDAGADMACPHCDEVCTTVYICRVCDTDEVHEGCEECLDCIVDAVVADPRELDSLTAELVVEVAKELAERNRPFLRQRQAA